MASLFKQLVASFSAVLGATTPAAAQEWALKTWKNRTTGRVTIYRYIKVFSPGFKHADMPVKVILGWKFNGNNGQPSGTDSASMNALEDAIEIVLGEDGAATLALVSTGDDLRQWTYYARSQDEFMTRLKHALAKQPPYPIDVHAVRDPDWLTYKALLSKLVT